MAAATGGGGGGGVGKIRNKRHHIISKPYTKNQGIIGRVTDTVKNIVPGWLQRYFGQASKVELAEAKASVDNHENNPVLVNETPPFDNRRHNSASETDNTAVNTQSKTALNFSDMTLLRPALNRTHFSCAAVDTLAHDCRPSTSSSFPIGNSGFSLVKEIKDSGSLHEDDNISTTSGFSSRASDKDAGTLRNASLPPLWSPEGDRFQSVPQQTASSLKKPAFNLTAFGSSSPSFISTSLLNSSQLGDSTFYPGKTTYGGAAAAGRTSQTRGTPYQVPIRRQMKAKPASSTSYGVTSATARRILQSLEKMSSPLADAKRIPSAVKSPVSTPLERSTIDVTGWQSKMRKVETQSPPVQKLQTPTVASGAANRYMFYKPSLTPGWQSNRHINRTEIRNNRPKEKSPVLPEVSLQTAKSDTSCSYQATVSHATNGLVSGGAGGKMKREKVHYSSRVAQEVQTPAPELPEISLPIKTTALPIFNFGSPAPPSPVTPAVTKPLPNKAVVSSLNSVAFTFSTPNIKATEANLPPVSVSTGFTFSEPIDKSVPFVTASPSINAAKCTSSPSVSTPPNKRKDEQCDGPLKPAKALKQGSVLDILKCPEFTSPPPSTQSAVNSLTSTPVTVKSVPLTTGKNENSSTLGFGDKFKPVEGSWQCGSCLLQNKSTDRKCVACQTANSSPPIETNIESANSNKETPLGFGEKFKPSVDSWNCDCCFIQNNSEAVKCIACEKPKPGTASRSALTLPMVTERTRTETDTSSGTSKGLVDMFKKPEGVWDCAICLVQNKSEDSKCVACQNSRPGVAASVPASVPAGGNLGFADKFKKPAGFWDCEVCLVQNSANVTKCVACQAEKPGNKTESKEPDSSAVPAATSTFVFGIQSSTTDSLQSNKDATKFKFGNQGGFKFGTSDSSSSTSAFGGLKFEAIEGFKFGVNSTGKGPDGNKENNSKTASGYSFNFGGNQVSASVSTATKFGVSDTSQQNPQSGVVFGGFKFGTVDKSGDKSTPGGFKFGTEEKKEVSTFELGKIEERKDGEIESRAIFGKTVEKEPVVASSSVFGKPDEKQDSLSSVPFTFDTKDVETQPQSEPSLKNPEQTKESALSSDISKAEAKSGFPFNVVKSPEKPEVAEPVQQRSMFGATVNTSEQAVTKPPFSIFGNSSSTSAGTNVGDATSSTIFGSSTPTTTPFLFGSAGAAMGSNLGSSSESTDTANQPFLFGSQEITSATSTSSTGAPTAPFAFGSAPSNNTATTSVFTFGASTTTSNSTGGSSNSIFAFGSSSTTAANPPTFGSTQNPVPVFGQSSSQPSAALAFSRTPTIAFTTGCQQPAFGSQSTNNQPSLFGGQLPKQPSTFGSTSSTSNNSFQFGNRPRFNFSATNSTNEVFQFGSSSAEATQPPAPAGGFQYNPTFSLGVGSPTNPFSAPSGGRSAIAGRKIKTAVRRKK